MGSFTGALWHLASCLSRSQPGLRLCGKSCAAFMQVAHAGPLFVHSHCPPVTLSRSLFSLSLACFMCQKSVRQAGRQADMPADVCIMFIIYQGKRPLTINH